VPRLAPSVVPLHSHKLISELQHALAAADPKGSPQRNPLLIRVEVSGLWRRPCGRSHCQATALPALRAPHTPATLCSIGSLSPPSHTSSPQVRAGHGAGKPTAKIIQETADLMAFAAKCMGAKWHGPEPKAASSK
jgi:prolyl oligopeptidase